MTSSPFPPAMADSPLVGQSTDPKFSAQPTAPPAPGFIAPPSYSPTPVQTQGYPLVAGAGGYGQVPGQAPYYGPPYSDQSGYPPGQGYVAGPGYGPPVGYVPAGAAAPVVTTQVVSGPGITVLQAQPVNNSLIVSAMGTRCLPSLITGIYFIKYLQIIMSVFKLFNRQLPCAVFSVTACICATLCCGLVPLICAFPALILSSIALCTAPPTTAAQAERKNTFARVYLSN